jgi:hypothetical protein
MVVAGQSDSYDSHIQAMRDVDASDALVYVADGHPFSLDLTCLAGDAVVSRWYDPRNGTTIGIGTVQKGVRVSFDPPGTPHYTNDWVLVLEAVPAPAGRHPPE